MKDRTGREINYMRISITDRCNLRCRYCMPEGIQWVSMSEILTYEEIRDICEEAVELGIIKFKITGGEPLVRKGCVKLVSMLKAIPGVEQVTMTTNGVLLKEYLDPLAEAGLDGINISLDTTDRKLYEQITGYDKLGEVLEAIEEAGRYPWKVKVNSVLQSGENEQEWKSLITQICSKGIDLRFIEMMPIGYGRSCETVSNQVLYEKIREAYPGIKEDFQYHGNGPAVYYRIPDFTGRVGFISAIHGKFCNSCNRIRLTSTGEVKGCLCYDEKTSLKEAVRRKEREEIRKLLSETIQSKPEMHCFENLESITEAKKMSQIGG